MNPWIPIGQLYIAALLEKNGVEVVIYDRNKETRSLFKLIDEFSPEHIGIGAMTVQAQDAFHLCAVIKSKYPSIPLSLGGVHFTFKPFDGINVADMVIVGEGEYTYLDICQDKPLGEIKGLIFKSGEIIIDNGPRPFIQNLDELPLPAYHLIDVNSYSDMLISGHKAISILTGRGCPYGCNFCASPSFWQRKVRMHSLDYAMNHIKLLMEKYGMRNLRIMDDTFTLKRDRVIEFCSRVKPLGLNMTCLTNVKNSDLELLKIMKDSGFSIVAYGIECADQGVLDAVGKGIKLEECVQAIQNAKSAGLVVELLFMVGNITETEETIKKSIRFACAYNPGGPNWFQFATPFPGSHFNEIAEQYGVVTNWDWNEWHHQAPIFIPKGLTAEKMIHLRNIALSGGSV